MFRNLLALVMIGWLLTPIAVAEEAAVQPPTDGPSGAETSTAPTAPANGGEDTVTTSPSQTESAVTTNLGAICVFNERICIPPLVCITNGGSGGSPVEFAPRGIGVVVATKFSMRDATVVYSGYIGGAVLC